MGGVESRQYDAPEQRAVVCPLRAVVGPEVEVAEVVVHHGREVEGAGREHRLDEERAYRAVHVQDVGANPTKGVLEAAQRHLGALSRAKARLEPVDGDAPVVVWGRGFAFGRAGCFLRLSPLVGGQDRGHERDVGARQGLEVREVVLLVPEPLAVRPDDVCYAQGDTPPSSRRVALARAVTIRCGSAVSCPAVSDSTRRTATRSASIRLQARPPVVSSVSFCAILYRFYLGGGTPGRAMTHPAFRAGPPGREA